METGEEAVAAIQGTGDEGHAHHFLRVALDNRKCILSQSWELEVQDRAVSRAALPAKALGENPSLPLLVCSGCWRSLAFLGL